MKYSFQSLKILTNHHILENIIHRPINNLHLIGSFSNCAKELIHIPPIIKAKNNPYFFSSGINTFILREKNVIS